MSQKNLSPLYRPKTAFDLLSIPVLGKALKTRYGRLFLQIPLTLIAFALIYDGFTGPQIAPQNLATVAPWIHYRGLVVLALLLVGNLFCMGCPFTLPRTLAKRFAISGIRFPKALRNKRLAIASLMLIFFLYEWLDLWSSPLLTAWVIIGYFIASFVLEAVFKESAFCKYVCPLGSFNFVYGTTAPTQIAIKDHSKCENCQGKECVNGSFSAQPIVRIDKIPFIDAQGVLHYKDVEVERNSKGVLGCGTELFAPQITSNLDCVYCLDCVRACPHDNIGLMGRSFGRELLRPDAWPRRWDVSLFVISLAFLALVNAFGMIPPVYAVLEWFASIGFTSEVLPLALIFIVGGLLLPTVVAVTAAWLTRLLSNDKRSLRDIVAAFAPAFVPIGLGIWMAHYGFHFLIAPLSIITVLASFFGLANPPQFSGVPVEIIGIFQLVALLGGFLWSMIVVQNVSNRLYKYQSFAGMLPWALVLLGMMFAAYQIFTMPMEMRGTNEIFTSFIGTLSHYL